MTERDPNYCKAHIDFVGEMAVIKTSIKNIENAIVQGISFKIAVVIAFLGIVVTIAIQIITFAFLFGEMHKQVQIDNERLALVEGIERDAQNIRSSNVARLKNLEDRLGNVEYKQTIPEFKKRVEGVLNSK